MNDLGKIRHDKTAQATVMQDEDGPQKTSKQARQPSVFSADDPSLIVNDVPDIIDEAHVALDVSEDSVHSNMHSKLRYFSWLSVLLIAIAGLLFMSAGLWLSSFVSELIARQDWIGWLSLGLVWIAVIAALMILLREITGLMQIKRISQVRRIGYQAYQNKDKPDAQKAVDQLKALYRGRSDLRWGLAQLQEHEKDILDADELLILAERELLIPLDEKASQAIAATARRVSVITAISPSALIDIVFVAYENLKLLKTLAYFYGGRPGGLGVFRLARLVLTHLTLTGGVALSSDLFQHFVSHKLSAKLSAKLGEGIFNGAMSARIGLAAIDICRPLPFIKVKRPRFRDFLSVLLKRQDKPNTDTSR